MNYVFRKAIKEDLVSIMEIIDFAKESRRKDGSNQWQDGYPNEKTILNDIEKRQGYVITENNEVLFYLAIIFGVEPAYEKLDSWLTNQDYCVIHRMAVSHKTKGKGLSTKALLQAEELCIEQNVFSIKIDTNFDNKAMLHLLEKLNYTYCGEVYFRGSPRKAFEKVLSQS